jgi:hypothetical protein
MPAGRKKVATDTSVRPPRRSRSERQRRTILRNLSSTNFRTASKTALPALPPSHTASIVPFATAPKILLTCYLALRALKRGVEVSQSGELREHPVYRQHAGQLRMPHAWHLSREIQICEKAHQRDRTQARVLTDDARQLRSAYPIEGSLTTIAWPANKRLSRSTAELSAIRRLKL